MNITVLPPHLQRVAEEKASLDERLTRLRAVLDAEFFAKLPLVEQGRMIQQAELMQQLSTVLGERLAAAINVTPV